MQNLRFLRFSPAKIGYIVICRRKFYYYCIAIFSVGNSTMNETDDRHFMGRAKSLLEGWGGGGAIL